MVKILHIIVVSFASGVFSSRSPYEILGIKRNANAHDIKVAYRELAKQLHPDKNRDDPLANDKFIEVSNAYEILSDDNKRREYDHTAFHDHQQTARRNANTNQHFHSHFHNRFHEHFNSEETVYAYRGADGRVYYSRGPSPTHMGNRRGPQGFTFHFDMSSISGLPLFAWLMPILMLGSMVLTCCSPIIFIWTISQFFRWIASPSGRSPLRSVRRERSPEDVPHESRSDALPVYEPVTKSVYARRHLISIIAITPDAELPLVNMRKKFLKDPLTFCRLRVYPSVDRADKPSEEVSPSPSPSLSPRYEVIAVSKSGQKWTGFESLDSIELERWIERVVSGEARWSYNDSLTIQF
mmetsp:Transcript_1689/g.1768  ORF Transcript_1689/g.1768 Transcript_1689/m.1768 type:complete len:353 (+) Transcript_1689:318-1376(+)